MVHPEALDCWFGIPLSARSSVPLQLYQKVGFDNRYHVSKDKGKLTKAEREKKTKVKTTRWLPRPPTKVISFHFVCSWGMCAGKGQYVKKDGTKGFSGSASLKATQPGA